MRPRDYAKRYYELHRRRDRERLLQYRKARGLHTLTHLERFDKFMKSPKPDKYGYTIKKVIEKAETLGFSIEDVRVACRKIRVWLCANEETGRANKLHWGKFVLNWLKNDHFRPVRRLAPSKFTGKSRIEE